MGVSHFPNPVASLTTQNSKTGDTVITFRDGETVVISNFLQAPVHKGIPPIGNFHWWCGKEAFIFLPPGWSVCCYCVNVTITNLALLPVNLKQHSENGHKHKLAEFSYLAPYHWHISLGEKWGIGLLPWHGVTFLADHIDNITNSVSAFAN